MATAEEYAKMSDSDKAKEDWMNKKWRPAMGWMYMLVCMADFVLFPILWSLIQVVGDGKVESQWMPITLQGAGLFHIAMGAILGIAAYGRTQEKLNDKAGGPAPAFGGPAPMTTSAPTFGAPAAAVPAFGAASKPAPAAPAPSPFAAPAQPPHPEI